VAILAGLLTAIVASAQVFRPPAGVAGPAAVVPSTSAYTVGGAPPAVVPPLGLSGRFQGAVDGSNLWLFDTATGAVWSAPAGGKWSQSVKPLSAE